MYALVINPRTHRLQGVGTRVNFKLLPLFFTADSERAQKKINFAL